MDSLDIIKTSDGSETLYSSRFDATYHSIHGAQQESQHVYITEGLRVAKKKRLHVLEMGFGTGLNAILSARYAEENDLDLSYTTIEKHRIPVSVARQYDTSGFLHTKYRILFDLLHTSPWEEWINISSDFRLLKIEGDLLTWSFQDSYDLVYYDAFSPLAQPELWTQGVFEQLYGLMAKGGILTTYCCKGQVRRNMLAAGLDVERLAGPPGKRHMLRATRN